METSVLKRKKKVQKLLPNEQKRENKYKEQRSEGSALQHATGG